jgi:hypothetical protein
MHSKISIISVETSKKTQSTHDRTELSTHNLKILNLVLASMLVIMYIGNLKMQIKAELRSQRKIY